MLRICLILLIVLSSGLASVAAADHGADMASGKMHQVSHVGDADHAHGSDAALAARSCDVQDGCPARMVLCAWACSALAAVAVGQDPVIGMVLSRTHRGLPLDETRNGTEPPLVEHPPQRLLL